MQGEAADALDHNLPWFMRSPRSIANLVTAFVILVVGVMCLIVAVLLYIRLEPHMHADVGYPVSFSPFVVAALTGFVYFKRSVRRAVRAVCLSGYCPKCGYCIQGLPVQSDGLTICPECGAAWRVGETEIESRQ